MSLKTCLDQSLVVELRAMARQHGLRLQSLIKRDIVCQLERRIVDFVSSSHWQQALSPDCCAALSALLDRGGSCPLEEIEARFGSLRPLRRSGIESDQPWADGHSTPLDTLHCYGLVFRQDAPEQTVAYIPPEVVEKLRPTAASRPQIFRQAAAPASILEAAPDLSIDLMLLVSGLRAAAAARLSSGGVSRRDLLRLNAHLLCPDDVPDGRGERWIRRFHFLRTIGESAGLITCDDGRFIPGPNVRPFLESAGAERRAAAVEAYASAANWSELDDLPTLQFSPAPTPLDLSRARCLLISLVNEADPDQWYSFNSLVQAARSRNSFLLRRPGDGSSVKCTVTGRDLGPRDWGLVEGAWIESALRGPLYWLGMVEPGMTRRGELIAFRRTNSPGEVADNRPDCPFQQPIEQSMAGDLAEPITLASDLSVAVDSTLDLMRWYRLEQFCELQERGPVSRYRLSRERVRQHLQSGGPTETIYEALGSGLTPDLAETLATWTNRFGQVRLLSTSVLLAANSALMAELRAIPEINIHLAEVLGSRASVVAEGKENAIVESLRAHGELPRIEGRRDGLTLDRDGWRTIVRALDAFRKTPQGRAAVTECLLNFAALHASSDEEVIEEEPVAPQVINLVGQLEEAIRKNSSVRFDYGAPGRAGLRSIIVQPKSIGQQSGETFLSGYRKGRSSLERFNLTGIVNLTT